MIVTVQVTCLVLLSGTLELGSNFRHTRSWGRIFSWLSTQLRYKVLVKELVYTRMAHVVYMSRLTLPRAWDRIFRDCQHSDVTRSRMGPCCIHVISDTTKNLGLTSVRSLMRYPASGTLVNTDLYRSFYNQSEAIVKTKKFLSCDQLMIFLWFPITILRSISSMICSLKFHSFFF